MKISELSLADISTSNKELVNSILYDGIEDDGQNGDILFVFGSTIATKYRVPLAVELYKSNRVPKILMSGGKQEAEQMMEKAVALGVPIEDIILETESTHTIENVTKSKKVLEDTYGLLNINRILVVSTFYHMRRCHLTLKTHMPDHIEYTLCPANDQITGKDNWWKTDVGTERVMKEIQRLIYYTGERKIVDFVV